MFQGILNQLPELLLPDHISQYMEEALMIVTLKNSIKPEIGFGVLIMVDQVLILEEALAPIEMVIYS